MYTKEEKLAIGKESYEKTDTSANLARKYHTSYGNIMNWRKAYMQSVGIIEVKPRQQGAKYENLNEATLREELMKKDIEIARLKKGYVVKGGGANKVYDTIPD